MRPARQGDFDGFCGLYALINALDPAGCGGPRKPLHRDLFVAMAHALPRRKLRDAIADGLEGDDLLKVANATFPLFKKPLRGLVSVTRPFEDAAFRTDGDFIQAISDIMASGRSGVILNVRTPSYRHWTVAAGVTEDEIVLRDSWATKGLSRARYTVKRGAYRIHARDTLMLHHRPLKRLA